MTLKKCSVAIFFIIALTISLAFFLSPVPSQTITQAVREKTPGQFVKLAHGVTHYQLQGDSNHPLAVMIHGFSDPYYVWDKNYHYLVKSGFRVLRYDLFGRGFSDRPNIKYDASLYSLQLHHLLLTLHIKPHNATVAY